MSRRLRCDSSPVVQIGANAASCQCDCHGSVHQSAAGSSVAHLQPSVHNWLTLTEQQQWQQNTTQSKAHNILYYSVSSQTPGTWYSWISFFYYYWYLFFKHDGRERLWPLSLSSDWGRPSRCIHLQEAWMKSWHNLPHVSNMKTSGSKLKKKRKMTSLKWTKVKCVNIAWAEF